VPDETVAFYVEKLAKHLKVECEQDVARQVASVSGGNLRLALNFFQSMVTAVESPLTADKARAFLGLAGRDVLYDMADAIADGKPGLSLEILERLMCTGPDAGQVLLDFSEVFRNAMLLAAKAKCHLSDGEAQRSESLAARMGLGRLSEVSSVFSGAYQALALNKNPKWVMESLVVKLSEAK
jgi:DNA polymerase-3 subunit gamma/tau